MEMEFPPQFSLLHRSTITIWNWMGRMKFSGVIGQLLVEMISGLWEWGTGVNGAGFRAYWRRNGVIGYSRGPGHHTFRVHFNAMPEGPFRNSTLSTGHPSLAACKTRCAQHLSTEDRWQGIRKDGRQELSKPGLQLLISTVVGGGGRRQRQKNENEWVSWAESLEELLEGFVVWSSLSKSHSLGWKEKVSTQTYPWIWTGCWPTPC